MKKILSAGIAVAALGSAPALAADLPARTKAPVYKAAPVPVVPLWTGFYVGVNGGYAWSARSSDLTAVNQEGVPIDLVTTNQQTLDANGGFFGGQIGYNWQIAPQWIAGIEADIQGAWIRGSANAVAPQAEPGGADGPAPTNASLNTKLNWFGTVRARLGYAFDQTLVYATGGFAFGGVKNSLTVTQMSEGFLLSGTATGDRTATGFAVGGGFEQLISRSMSLKVEYQYIDLGSTTLSALAVHTTSGNDEGVPVGTPDCCDRPSGSATVRHAFHTVRVGLNFKFGGP